MLDIKTFIHASNLIYWFHTKKFNKVSISVNQLDQNCIKNITCSKVQIIYKLQNDWLFYISLVFKLVLENVRSESQDSNKISALEKEVHPLEKYGA